MLVTPHAVERYRLHHPGANGAAVMAARQRGRPATVEEIRSLGVRHPHGAGSEYVIAADGRGAFVDTPNDDHWAGPNDRALVTYLRFDAAQREAAAKLLASGEVARV
jgi:hypothetical protein